MTGGRSITMKITEAIILAGGLGTRLKSEVPDLPKCMAPVAGKPFLDHVIQYYLGQGIQRFIFSLGHLRQVIEDFLHRHYGGLQYTVVTEDSPLGTGGAIKNAMADARSPYPLILNGDTLFEVSLEEMERHVASLLPECALCLKPMQQFDRYGAVEMDAGLVIQSFREKRFYESGLINGGVYALDRKRFTARNLPDIFSFEKDYLEHFCREGSFTGLVQDRYFIDIGIPEDYKRAQQELKGT